MLGAKCTLKSVLISNKIIGPTNLSLKDLPDTLVCQMGNINEFIDLELASHIISSILSVGY